MNGIKAEASAEWIPIYRFKLITVIAAISKIKILQTALTVVLVPVAWKQYMDAAQSPTLVLIISFAAVVALVMLYVVTALTRRTIGVISKHWLQSVVRIGYLDFWGFRRNIIVPIEDLVPLTDISYDKRGAYLKLERLLGNS
ncbi:unnamed protein product [Soboliphyme baturini]|uniref:Transmembrane protein 186 n=1 Tax=Soboliphyme baturini TaxID=241478 RepID=A0A183IYM7_9BILA|nr:unnamed protein product [Soboliphyme baturini]